MLAFTIHSTFLGLAIILTYFWTKNPTLSSYNLQLTGLLTIFYFLSRLLIKKNPILLNLESTVIFTSIILLLIFSTGSLESPLFFLLDFLLFALALFVEPFQAGAIAILISLIFLATGQNLTTTSAVNLFSLLLITPLAIIFGKKFLENQASSGKIEILEKTIADEETDTLLWITTKSKPTLISIIDNLSQVIGSNRLPFPLEEKLKKSYSDLIALNQSADVLEKKIDSPYIRPSSHKNSL
jgi:hypothetical protein